MRRIDVLAGLVALVSGALGAHLMGCVIGSGENDCSTYPDKTKCGAGGGSTSSGPSSSSGTGGAPPVECTAGDPTAPVDTMTMKTGNIRDECAVFVRADSPSTAPDGTMENPFKTLADAVSATNSAKKKLFACKSAPFTESVAVGASIEIYGGFDCSAALWTWAATDQTSLTSAADTIPLTLTASSDGAVVSNLAITAAASATDGGSSIGVAVDDVATGVTIKRSAIAAGAGMAGNDGQTPTNTVTVGAPAPTVVASAADACINPGSLVGGPPGMTMCPGAGTMMIDTSGGAGGKGGITGTNSGNGAMGANGSPTNGTNGQGGAGQTDPNDSSKFCQDGTKGLAGGTGSKGSAGSGVAAALTGLTGGDGGSGGTGIPGQGGGGGGGAKSGVFCPPGSVDGNGASGGGGGAGGCGGNGGGGGKAGGSSIAILSLGTKLIIDISSVALTSSAAADGGNGAPGQSEGTGGVGSLGGSASSISPSLAGCQGGAGGNGGGGGPGGGGRGGFSAGVAFAKGPVPTLKFTTTPVVGAKGSGGTSSGTAGTDGAAGAVCDFSQPTPSCM